MHCLPQQQSPIANQLPHLVLQLSSTIRSEGAGEACGSLIRLDHGSFSGHSYSLTHSPTWSDSSSSLSSGTAATRALSFSGVLWLMAWLKLK